MGCNCKKNIETPESKIVYREQLKTQYTTREAIIKDAYTWLDTPYHHKAMVKGVGVDCAQLVLGIAINTGQVPEDTKIDDYSTEWHLHNNEELMLQVLQSFGCKEVPKDELLPGDILCFKYGRVSSHLAIYLPNHSMIHAHLNQDRPRVTLHSFNGEYMDRLAQVYQFPGVVINV